MSYAVTLGGIALVNFLGIVSPGPAFLLVSRTAAARSRAVGLATGLGVSAASTLWAAAATFGVAVMMTRFVGVYEAVQLLGGTYLIWLGLSAWHDSAHESPPAVQEAAASASADAPPPSHQLWRAVLTGTSLTLTNPKVVVFFSSIFVALVPADAPLWLRLAALAIVATQETLWFAFVALIFSHPPVQAGYRRIKGAIDRLMGAVFVAFGARLVALARV